MHGILLTAIFNCPVPTAAVAAGDGPGGAKVVPALGNAHGADIQPARRMPRPCVTPITKNNNPADPRSEGNQPPVLLHSVVALACSRASCHRQPVLSWFSGRSAESAFHIPDTGRGPAGDTAPSQNSHPPFPRHLPGTNSTPQYNKGRRFPDARNRRRWQVSPLSPTKATPKIP